MQHARIFNSNSSSRLDPQVDSGQNEVRNMNSVLANRPISTRPMPTTRSNIMRSQVGATLTIGKYSHFKSTDKGREESRSASPRNTTTGNGPVNNDDGPGGRTKSVSSTSKFNSVTFESIQLTLWFHELRTSPEDVILDTGSIEGLMNGDICELTPAKSHTPGKKPKRLVFTVPRDILHKKELKVSNAGTAGNAGSSGNVANNFSSTSHYNSKNLPNKTKSAALISLLSNPLQSLMDLVPRSSVQIKKVHAIESVEIDTVEIFIKDINLSRDLMWIMSSQLVGSCVYKGKRLVLLEKRVGEVKEIIKNGHDLFSGYISETTKVVFRSKSAKLLFLVQLSQEMWHFEETGEIMFHKLVNTLFPQIFKRWRDKNTHHSITIVLFTSVDLTNVPWTSLGQGERPNNCRDFFRVAVDQISIFHWDRIMSNLRLEFASFKRDILLNRKENGTYELFGQSLPSVKGNVLEAINLGITLVNDRFRNTDLKHSVTNLILITPGTGLFDVDYKSMYETSKKMSNIDYAMDFICLSQPPLHVVPLFRYKDPTKNGGVSYCVPHWCDISYYRDRTANSTQWVPRCKIYELQMMGVMENDINGINIKRFKLSNHANNLGIAMDEYDDQVFKISTETEPTSTKVSDSSFASNHEKPAETLVSTKMDYKKPLFLIQNPKTSLSPAPVSTTNASTSNTFALATVANSRSNLSALSTLYTLNKPEERSATYASTLTSNHADLTSNTSLRSSRSSSKIQRSGMKPIPHLHSDELHKNEVFAKRERKLSSERGTLMSKKASKENIRDVRDSQKITNNPLWTEISNPSQELDSDILSFIRLGRWNDVFPPNIKRGVIQWRSYESPAALPITTPLFPTKKQLDTDYTFQIYSVFLNSENEFEISTTYDLMREMINLRLLLGFQICYGNSVKWFENDRNIGGSEGRLIKYFPKKNCFGCVIYMSLDDEYHRIYCDYNGNLFVQLYRRNEQTKRLIPQLPKSEQEAYLPMIRTRYMEEYSRSKIDYMDIKPVKYNWNQFDQLVAGYSDAMPADSKQFHKMKFVVLPADIPKNAYFISNESLTDEEIRVEGLRKLIMMVERGKVTKTNNDKTRKKEEIFPEISFYTGNLYEFLSSQAEVYESTGNQPNNSLMLPDSVKFNKSISLGQLAIEMQGPQGLKLSDRIWHFKKHLHCFLGSELVSWLIETFTDIDNREDATKYGQSLMDKKMFKHVESRHRFLDGYYFYEFEDEYVDKTSRAEKSTNSWFRKKNHSERLEQSSNSKATSDSDSMISPLMFASEGSDLKGANSILLSQHNVDSENSSVTESSLHTKSKKKKFILSNSVRYNVDPLKKSFRPEIVTVHYDRVHNPDHCYHIRLEWLNASSKLIDETIVNWSRLCERHGLRLVEMPWKELCTVPSMNPFHSFVDMNLVINPWTDPEFLDPKILKDNRFYYHLYLLKKSEFLLDNRSTVFFLKDKIEISYSWGKPSFQYAQYIHKTGAYIIELRETGDLFLAPNNIHITRLNSFLSSSSELDTVKAYQFDAQKIMLEFRAMCADKTRLCELFRQAKEDWREDCLENVLSVQA